MLTENLFERVLVDPALRGGRKLHIVSGFGTPAMAFHHMSVLREKGLDVGVELILGMSAETGLGESHHLGFKKLVEEDLKDSFKCSYLRTMPPVHSKVYAWTDGAEPVAGFAGSANYSQAAFATDRREAMVTADPSECLDYFQSLVSDTIYCDHIDADREIFIYNDKTFEYKRRMGRLTEDIVAAPGTERLAIEGLDYVKISFLDQSGKLPQRSGLNWGQRPEYGREPNQAYIRVPLEIARTAFFPPRGVHFTLNTDDGKILICTRAQDRAKAIETPYNNSLIGIYFRRRLGLKSGQMVDVADLLRYGRTDVDFYKIDPETYYMDFSP